MRSFLLVTIFCKTIFSLEDPCCMTLARVLKKYPDIIYQSCYESKEYRYKPFPLYRDVQQHPHEGSFGESYVVTIPQGKVLSRGGYIVVDSYIITDFWPQNYTYESYVKRIKRLHKRVVPKKIKGRALVLASRHHDRYGHWLHEVFSKLHFVEKLDISYDWIITPLQTQYQKDVLQLFGIDLNRVIDPCGESIFLEADELIVPSNPVRRLYRSTDPVQFKYYGMTNFYPDHVVQFLRDTFLPHVTDDMRERFSKKIFISRKDTSRRNLSNEDDVFEMLQQYGFKRYALAEMSFLEQVALFSGAEYVIAAHGAGLTNLIFSPDSVKVLELFQNRYDASFWNLCCARGYQYDCMTCERRSHYVSTISKVSVSALQERINSWLS